MNDIIIDILNTKTPSGYATDMYQKIKKYISSDWDISIDNIGNIYCKKEHKKGPYLMIEAHYDEIGLMVNNITSTGFINVRPIGNINPFLLLGREMTVMTQNGETTAIAGHNPPITTNKRDGISDITEVLFDMCNPKHDCNIGDYIIFPHNAHLNSDKIIGAGIDNKSSVAAMILCMLSSDLIIPDNISLCFCFSAREEILHKGIKRCIEIIKPDIVISLDTTFASDVPGTSTNSLGNITLGNGPAILFDPCCNRELTYKIIQLTNQYNLPLQSYCNIYPSTGLNVTQIDYSKTVALLLPCRNMHSPVEICSLNDIYSLVNILKKLIQTINII